MIVVTEQDRKKLEKILSRGKQAEIKIEHGKVVIIEISRTKI